MLGSRLFVTYISLAAPMIYALGNVLVCIQQLLACYSHCIHASSFFPGKLHSPLSLSGFFWSKFTMKQ